MENNKITEYRRDLYALIKDRKLSDTFSKLLEVCKLCGDWHVSDKITELENSYKYMLSYMQEGVVDPERKKIYKKFLADSYELTDILTDKLFQNDSSTLFYSKRRYFLTATDTLENMVKRFGNELANQKLTSELPESERGPREIGRAHV